MSYFWEDSDELWPDPPRWHRGIQQLERLTGRELPWGDIWTKGGFSLMFPTGLGGGFCVVIPLPRLLPGFVKSYQVQELRTLQGRWNSNLHLLIPVFPLGRWHTSRTRRISKRNGVIVNQNPLPLWLRAFNLVSATVVAVIQKLTGRS